MALPTHRASVEARPASPEFAEGSASRRGLLSLQAASRIGSHEERQNPQQQGPRAARGRRGARRRGAVVPRRRSPSISAASSPPPASARTRSATPPAIRSFLAGVLDHLSGNEPLLIAFAQHAGHRPDRDRTRPRRARRRLGTGRAVMAAFCRDCLRDTGDAARCPACFSPRILRHAELDTLTICHVDCDAFYATIEKRDDPTLADKPLIIGGGKRGVVSTACYIARTFGVRSAMPMFEAKRLCPHATVVRPNMDKYADVSRQVRALMLDMTPQVEPISIDEAFMDLAGTAAAARHERRQGAGAVCRPRREARSASPSRSGLPPTSSWPRSPPTSTSRAASPCWARPRPRRFLADKPVSLIYGVGKVAAQRFAKDGFRLIADLQRADERELMRRYGAEGQRLSRLARGIDAREVDPVRERKSVSAENTFERDIASFRPLEKRLWAAAEEVSDRLKEKRLCGSTVTLKLKTADFRILTRARSLESPTQLAGQIFGAAPRAAGARDQRHALPPARRRRQRAGRCRGRRPGRPDRPLRRAPRRRRARHGPRARQVRPRGRGEGPGAGGKGLTTAMALGHSSPSDRPSLTCERRLSARRGRRLGRRRCSHSNRRCR